MLRFLAGKTSERKLRLFATECFRRLARMLPDSRQHRAIHVLEEMAEGTATRADRNQATMIARAACYKFPSLIGTRNRLPVDDPHFVGLMLYRELASSSPATHALTALAGLADGATEQARRATSLSDIFGNPFRPVTFSPHWKTDTAVSLAKQMYDSREFSAMPILADALQDVGCANADVLSHCRGDGPHVRGCWVVDLVLGLA